MFRSSDERLESRHELNPGDPCSERQRRQEFIWYVGALDSKRYDVRECSPGNGGTRQTKCK